MEPIWSKVWLLLGSMLSLLVGQSYVQLDVNDLNFNFKDGDPSPIIYYLNVKNIGIEQARFDISAETDWFDVYRENQPTDRSVTIPQENGIKFTVEIPAHRLPDGENKARITVKAVSLRDFTTIESRIINLTVNKNIKPATPTPEVSVVITPTPEVSATQTPPVIKTSPVPIVKQTAVPKIIQTTLTPTPVGAREESIKKQTISPTISIPPKGKGEAVDTKPAPRRSFFRSIRLFFRNLLPI